MLSSVENGTGTPLRLDLRAARLGVEAALARGFGRPGSNSLFRPDRRPLQECREPAQRVGAAALLRTMGVGGDDENTVERKLAPGQKLKALHHVEGQARALEVAAQFDRGGDLVDILAAGAGGADKALAERVIGDGQARRNSDHRGNL